MKRFLPTLCSAFCLVVLFADHAYAQAYGQVESPKRGRNGRLITPSPTPANNTQAPVASATPVPVQEPGVIVSVAQSSFTIVRGDTKISATYKVTQYSKVTLNGQTAPFSSLKPGMLATVIPNDDQIYADAVAASDPPPAPPAPAATPDPALATAPAPTPAAAPSPSPSPVARVPIEQPTY